MGAQGHVFQPLCSPIVHTLRSLHLL